TGGDWRPWPRGQAALLYSTRAESLLADWTSAYLDPAAWDLTHPLAILAPSSATRPPHKPRPARADHHHLLKSEPDPHPPARWQVPLDSTGLRCQHRCAASRGRRFDLCHLH